MEPPSSPKFEEDDKSRENTSIPSEGSPDFHDKHVPAPNNMTGIPPLPEHRCMARTVYLDSILYHASLREHAWILLSQNEKCKGREWMDHYSHP
jgi:hypothetical protein